MESKRSADEIILYAYFGDFHYSKYSEQETLDLANFIALVGGTIGGWTGMSFITYGQIVVFILAIVWKQMKRFGSFCISLCRGK
jgi:Amiloride-sensitive sodium channel